MTEGELEAKLEALRKKDPRGVDLLVLRKAREMLHTWAEEARVKIQGKAQAQAVPRDDIFLARKNAANTVSRLMEIVKQRGEKKCQP